MLKNSPDSGKRGHSMLSFFSSDIHKLNTLYNRMQFSFIFLYGRYDTGKTQLVREFCQGRRTLFFSAQESVPQRQLHAFWREATASLKPEKKPAPFADWKQAFAFVSDVSFTHRIILVLDEFQHLMQDCPGFADAFETAVRHDFPSGKVFLITTCSSPAYAAGLMQEPIAAPFDAITARARLEPLPFPAFREYLAPYAPKEQLMLYGITGGLASNFSRLAPGLTAAENILRLFFRPDSPLLFAPQTYLHRELREISTYNFLLEIVAEGYSKLSEISARAAMGTNKCAKYLHSLIDLGILQKEVPAAGELQKKVRYVFADHMMRFWYRFVCPNLSGILFGDGEAIYEKHVLPAWDEYLLPIFENVCADYLERLADTKQTPFAYRHTSSWWCGGTKREPYFRIPLVALDDTHTVLGACHCGTEPAGMPYLEELLQPLEPFDGRKRYCCIFSASGFTPELADIAASRKDVWLIELADITAG